MYPFADSPLYIFDGSFAEKRGSRSMRHDYSIPSLFSEDLMRLGGEHRRPPYRCACIEWWGVYIVQGSVASGFGMPDRSKLGRFYFWQALVEVDTMGLGWIHLA